MKDTDPMPFGKYRGIPIQDVPSSYLNWLHEQNCGNKEVANYIKRNMEGIRMDLMEEDGILQEILHEEAGDRAP